MIVRPSLTATLDGKLDIGRSVSWAVDGAGHLFRIEGGKQVVSVKLPAGYLADQVLASTNVIWALCSSASRSFLFRSVLPTVRWEPSFEFEQDVELFMDLNDEIWQVQPDALVPLASSDHAVPLPMTFNARHVNVASNGTFWAIGGEKRFGGLAVWRRGGASLDWFSLPQPAAAIRIAGAPDGTAWALNNRGDLWRLHPDGAGSFRECGLNPDCRNCLYSDGMGKLLDIAVDREGTLWGASKGQDGNVDLQVLTDFAKRRFERQDTIRGLRSFAAATRDRSRNVFRGREDAGRAGDPGDPLAV